MYILSPKIDILPPKMDILDHEMDILAPKMYIGYYHIKWTNVYLLKRYSPSDSFCTFFSESVNIEQYILVVNVQ